MHRRGFTLLEVTVVSGLTVFLAVVLSGAWAGVGRPAADLVSRAELVQEMEMAVETLGRDLGGRAANPAARLGDKRLGRWVGWQPSNSELRLCFDGGSDPNGQPDWAVPDTVIIYRRDGPALVRWDGSTNTTHTVARNLTGLSVTSEGSDSARIVLTFHYHGLTRTCTLIARSP